MTRYLIFDNSSAGFGTQKEIIINWDNVKYIEPVDATSFKIQLNNGGNLSLTLSTGTPNLVIKAIQYVVKAIANGKELRVSPDSLNAFQLSGITFTAPTDAVGIDGSGVQYAVPVFTDTKTITNLPLGTAGQVLTSGGAGVDPSWATASGGPANVTDTTSGINVTSPGTQNLFIGFEAGNLNSSNENVFIGYQAGEVSTGSDNTLIGNEAGEGLTTGSRNVFIGHEAGETAGTGGNSVYIGWNAGSSSSGNSGGVSIGYQAGGGTDSVFIGNLAGGQVSSSTNTVSVGYRAHYQGTETGNIAIGYETHYKGVNEFVTAMGYQALKNLNELDEVWTTVVGYQAGLTQSGSGNNSYFGHRAGYAATSGAENTLLGSFAGDALTTGSNNIVIGYNAAASSVSVSNEITLGNASITAIRAAVTSITSLSDERDKKDIKDLTYGLDFISKLQPREFVWNNRVEQKTFLPQSEKKETPVVSEIVSANKGKKDFGFIAQEVQTHDDDTLRLIYDANPDKLEMSYGKLVPILVKAIQELKVQLDNKQDK